MVSEHVIDLGKTVDAEQAYTDLSIPLDPAVKIFEEAVLVPKSGQRIHVALQPVISYRSGKVFRFTGQIPDHDAAAGAHIVFTRDAPGPVLHVMVGCNSRKDFIDTLMIGFPVFGMDPVLPYVSRAVHVFRRQAK